MDDRKKLFEVMIGLGLVARERGEHERAGTLFAAALALYPAGETMLWFTLIALEGAAGVIGARGRPRRAARLFGAADAMRQAYGIPVRPSNRALLDRDVAAVRRVLGREAFSAAYDAGRALPFEQAVAEAVETLR